MIMKNYTKWIVGVFCAVALTVSAFAAEQTTPTLTLATKVVPTEAWVISLGGAGASNTDGDGTDFGVDLSFGRTGKWIVANEYGLRQSFGYGDDDVTFNTRLYNDWTLLQYKTLDLFAGGAIGLQYGNQKPSWEIAPEAGARWWVKKDVAVLGRVEIPWDLAEWEFKDTVRYFLGFQVRF